MFATKNQSPLTKGNTMMRLFQFATALLLFVSPQLLHAQLPGGANSGVNTALLKLFGKHNNFSVTADMQMLDAAQKEAMSMTFKMAVLDGNMRADIDLANIKGAMMPPEAIAQMKQMGMDRVASVMRADKNRMYVIYPGLKSYVDLALPKEAAASLKQEPKV
jgi:hypothetical protein